MLHCKIIWHIPARKFFSTLPIMVRLVILHRVINTSKENPMSTLPEQFSAARKSQVEAQINFFQNYASTAVENAEKLISLNLSTTRASMEKSSAAVRQLFTVKDPRDLFALTTQTQESFESMLAYGRQLFSIASGTQAALLKQAVPVIAPPVPELPEVPKVAPAKAPEAVAAPVVVEADEPQAAPAAPVPVKAKPIAKAASKVGAVEAPAKPAAAPVPVASSPVVVTSLKAVEAAPPSVEPKQLDMLIPKAKAKTKK
jgi:phasin family protein